MTGVVAVELAVALSIPAASAVTPAFAVLAALRPPAAPASGAGAATVAIAASPMIEVGAVTVAVAGVGIAVFGAIAVLLAAVVEKSALARGTGEGRHTTILLLSVVGL